MTRAQFLNDLYRRLAGNGMNADQAEQHLTYYAEMLADRMEEGMTEEQAVSRMEDVDTIARRILEEEGLPYRPPEALAAPPVRPDGAEQRYLVPRKWDRRKLAQIALWALAAVIALGAAGRWLWTRDSGRYRSNAPTASMDSSSSVPVEEAAPIPEVYEGYGWDVPYEYGYEFSSGVTSCSSVNELDIQWAAGTVFIQSWSGEDIQVVEYANTELNARNAMVLEEKDGKLTIRYRSSTSLGSVKGDKWLTVMVPDGMLEELDVETTSAGVQLNGLEQGELDVSTTSGCIHVTECYVQKADLETISGEVYLSGIYGAELDISTTSGYVSGESRCVDVEVETISGDVNLNTGDNTEKIQMSTTSGDLWCSVFNAALRSIGANSVSGDVSLSIPYDMGFTLEYSTVSGGLNNSGFDMVMRDGKAVYNGGGCEVKVDTVSGDLDIY